VAEKQQARQQNLDYVTIYSELESLRHRLAEIEKRLLKIDANEERLLKIETMQDVLSTGQSIMCSALENAGLMKNGEVVKTKVVKVSWNPTKIKWREAEGSRGPYQRYPPKGEKAESTNDYHNLLADLKRHDGKLSRNGIFYWLFNDKATIGRKRRK